MASPEPEAWVDGRVFTGSGYAEAVLAEGGRFVAVGSRDEVRRAAPTGTVWHPLGGRLVVPGLIDPHLHWRDSVVAAVGVDLRGCRSLREIGDRVAAADAPGAGTPVFGHGWDQERLPERRYPTRRDLDTIEADRPVVLTRVCQHAAVLNSRALERLGIGRDTVAPPGGRIGREADGEPDGLLFDRALGAIRPLYEPFFTAHASAALDVLARLSVRAVTMIGAMNAGRAEVALLAERRGAPLPVGLRAYLSFELRTEAAALRAARLGPEARVVGVKLVLDGSLGARTAWLEAPYTDEPSARGYPLLTDEEATEAIRAAHAERLQVAMHAIGDRALHAAVELAERSDGPSRIEHASVVPPVLLDRVVRLGAPIVVQPGFLESDSWIPARLGPVRARWTYPFRQLIERGAAVAASSDAPVEPFDPWIGIRILVHRVGLAPEVAVRLYSTMAARALGESDGGRIGVGAPASLAVLAAPDLPSAIQAGGPVVQVVHRGRVVVGEGAI